MYFYDDEERLVSLPIDWTSVSAADPFVVLSAGRSAFRAADPLELARLVGQLQEGGAPRGHCPERVTVKPIMPQA